MFKRQEKILFAVLGVIIYTGIVFLIGVMFGVASQI